MCVAFFIETVLGCTFNRVGQRLLLEERSDGFIYIFTSLNGEVEFASTV